MTYDINSVLPCDSSSGPSLAIAVASSRMVLDTRLQLLLFFGLMSTEFREQSLFRECSREAELVMRAEERSRELPLTETRRKPVLGDDSSSTSMLQLSDIFLVSAW